MDHPPPLHAPSQFLAQVVLSTKSSWTVVVCQSLKLQRLLVTNKVYVNEQEKWYRELVSTTIFVRDTNQKAQF